MIVVAVVIKHHRIRGPLRYIASALITLYDACTDLIGSVAASFTKGKSRKRAPHPRTPAMYSISVNHALRCVRRFDRVLCGKLTEGKSSGPLWRGGGDVPGGGGAVVAAGDAEGEGLADEDGIGLPVLAPVAGHGHPPGAGALHAGADDVAGAGHVGDEHQVEVLEAVDGEPYPARLPARHPAQETALFGGVCITSRRPTLETLHRHNGGAAEHGRAQAVGRGIHVLSRVRGGKCRGLGLGLP
ncbi:hypothetical protein BHE74_00053307 [Ensete ventricosum]|nr:hypothetical protein BHE74_00053307 [Ensete ventricosum]